MFDLPGACAGTSNSERSANLRWQISLPGSDRRYTCNKLAGTRPAFFRRYLNVRPLLEYGNFPLAQAGLSGSGNERK